MFVRQGGRVDVYTFFFGVVEDLTFLDFEHELLGLFLDAGQDVLAARDFAFAEEEDIDAAAFREGADIDLFLFLFGRHEQTKLYLSYLQSNSQ